MVPSVTKGHVLHLILCCFHNPLWTREKVRDNSVRVHLTPVWLQLKAQIKYSILPNPILYFFMNMSTIVYFTTFICDQATERFHDFGFISLVVNLRVHNDREPCILISRLIIL